MDGNVLFTLYAAKMVLSAMAVVQVEAYGHKDEAEVADAAVLLVAVCGSTEPEISAATVHTVRTVVVGELAMASCKEDALGEGVQSDWASTTPDVHSAAPRIVIGRPRPSCCKRNAKQYG